MIESDARTGELRLHLAMTAIEPNKLFTTFVVSRKFPEIPRQSHGAHGETGGSERAMEIVHRVEAPVLMVHEPIEGVGGTMSPREARGARELRAFAAEFADHLSERPYWQARRGPRAQTA